MNKKLILTTIIPIFFIGLDQLSKYFFYNLHNFSHLPLFHPILNTGISRSIPVPGIISIIIAIFCSALFIFLYSKKLLTKLDFSLLISGTIGNLIDRLLLGGVRDFIAIGDFPVFNFADIFLTIGVSLVLIREIFLLTPTKKGL